MIRQWLLCFKHIHLLNPTPSTFPERWHPATWLQKGIVGRVNSQPVPSGIYGPSGQPIMHLSINVSFEIPSETGQEAARAPQGKW
jgi:hypothetical protein